MNKKVIILLCIVLIVVCIGVGVFLGFIKPLNDAKAEYEKVTAPIVENNEILDNAISKLQGLIDSDEKPVDETIIDTSKEAIKEAQANKIILESLSNNKKEIQNKTEELRNITVDYTQYLTKIENETNKLSKSIETYKKFLNPTSDFIISNLATIDEVVNSAAVTEDNDPNGKLNKPGGYTATVYFESSNVNQSEVYSDDNSLIGKGTDAGGSIEVYVNEEDAKKRDQYLATFDGGILSSGSHRVIGTTLIRTSDKLTASQQKALEAKIVEAFGN